MFSVGPKLVQYGNTEGYKIEGTVSHDFYRFLTVKRFMLGRGTREFVGSTLPIVGFWHNVCSDSESVSRQFCLNLRVHLFNVMTKPYILPLHEKHSIIEHSSVFNVTIYFLIFFYKKNCLCSDINESSF